MINRGGYIGHSIGKCKENDQVSVNHENTFVKSSQLNEAGFIDNGNQLINDNNIYFKDVFGLDEIKNQLKMAFLAPTKEREIFDYYNKTISGGILMYGPPGCGKTFLAKALANEIGFNFLSISLKEIFNGSFSESGTPLLSAIESAVVISLAVIFIDEFDAVGLKRSANNLNINFLVSQLLTDLDGILSNGDGIFYIASTNRPWNIDEAFKRPGRFSQSIFVGPPTDKVREIMISHMLGNKFNPL